MQWRLAGNSITILTPAKLNLFLEVLGKRTDGFHELQTLITGIDVYDRLEITRSDKPGIELRCRWDSEKESDRARSSIWGDLPQGSQNLVYAAAELFLNHCDIQSGLDIDMIKSIPSQAGLGGASGNAAGTLLGLNELFQTGCSLDTLCEWSAELGSDVPFFVHSRMAVCEGRGERIQLVDQTRDMFFVVVKPEFGMSTPEIFSQVSIPNAPQSLETQLLDRSQTRWFNLIFNRLQEAATKVAPEIQQICDRLLGLGCAAAAMTGSGSCCFGVCETPQEAQEIAEAYSKEGSGFVFTCRNLEDFPVRE